MICRSEQVSGKDILDTAFVGLNIITELTLDVDTQHCDWKWKY